MRQARKVASIDGGKREINVASEAEAVPSHLTKRLQRELIVLYDVED